MLRKIVLIDEEKCDGCGQCVPACAEGAIAVVRGKARLSSEILCDGLGACLGECPRGAITVVEREAAPFDPAAVEARRGHDAPGAPAGRHPARRSLAVVAAPEGPPGGGCPGSRPRTLSRGGLAVLPGAQGGAPAAPRGASRLGQWPVQLHLVPVAAPFFAGADLLVAADCVPFAHARFHEDLLDGRALVVGCPKLDDVQAYVEKLGRIFAANDLRSVTIARMEVPCCGGISAAARRGLALAGKSLPVREVVVGVDGELRG